MVQRQLGLSDTPDPDAADALALALVWDAAGGYGPVPWLLLAIALFAMASFYAASRPRGTQ